MENIYKNAEKHSLERSEAYTYDMLIYDIDNFKEQYPSVLVFSIGKSVQGRNILALKLGGGPKRIFICGAHHGMEWMTAKICMQFAIDICDLTTTPPSPIGNTSPYTGEALRNGGVSVYIVPMVNPDGVELAASGIKWQANANGVDLNHNYDALWELASQTEKKHGVYAPCASKYGGTFPESEPESRAVADFTRENNFDLAVALHSQGEVIYYDFCGIVPTETEEYLSRFEAVSHYCRELPEGTAICGGYKDWFIKKYKKPAFTIEVGLGKNPLPMSQFDDVYAGVLPILRELIKA